MHAKLAIVEVGSWLIPPTLWRISLTLWLQTTYYLHDLRGMNSGKEEKTQNLSTSSESLCNSQAPGLLWLKEPQNSRRDPQKPWKCWGTGVKFVGQQGASSESWSNSPMARLMLWPTPTSHNWIKTGDTHSPGMQNEVWALGTSTTPLSCTLCHPEANVLWSEHLVFKIFSLPILLTFRSIPTSWSPELPSKTHQTIPPRLLHTVPRSDGDDWGRKPSLDPPEGSTNHPRRASGDQILSETGKKIRLYRILSRSHRNNEKWAVKCVPYFLVLRGSLTFWSQPSISVHWRFLPFQISPFSRSVPSILQGVTTESTMEAP